MWIETVGLGGSPQEASDDPSDIGDRAPNENKRKQNKRTPQNTGLWQLYKAITDTLIKAKEYVALLL